MTRTWIFLACLLAWSCLSPLPAGAAQDRPAPGRADTGTLAQQVERRFDVLLLREGVVLRPRPPRGGVNAVEIGASIAIDGTPVTGAELRDKLGADADMVLQLSYLDPAARRALFGGRGAPVDAAAPAAQAPPETPARGAEPDDRRGRDENRVARDEDRTARRTRRTDRVKFGGGITVASGETIDGDVVAFGGPVKVDGEVRGDVVAVIGSVDLGPHAVISKNVVVVGGVLTRDPGARVDGEIQEVGQLELGRARWPSAARGLIAGSIIGAGFSLMATLTRVAVLCLLAALVILLGHGYVERVGAHAAAEPLKSGAIGLLAQVLFLPLLIITILVLVLTIVGIPLLILLPFLILGLLLVGLVGFTAVGYQVGRLLNVRLGWTRGPYATTIAGILVVVSPLILARIVGLGGFLATPIAVMLVVIGTIVEYVAWTVGFGAVALARFARITPAA